MRTYDAGWSYYTVQCTKRDVEEFASKWPCFGPVRAITFQFCKRTGDLLDLWNDSEAHDKAGILALSEDAMWHGARKLKLKLPRCPSDTAI